MTSAGTCAELADVTINLFQEAIDSVADLSVEEFLNLADGEDMPAAITRLDTMGEDLEARAAQLGCSREDGIALTCDRIGGLKGNSEVAQLMIEGFAGFCG